MKLFKCNLYWCFIILISILNISCLPKLEVFLDQSKWEMEIPIVTYWGGPTPITEFDARQMRDGGWNVAWITSRGMSKNDTLINYYLTQLDILEKYNLKGMIDIGEYTPRNSSGVFVLDNYLDRKKLDKFIDAVKKHNAFYAYNLKDEPSSNIFKNLERLKAYILEKDSTHLIYVNLFPIYAKIEKLGVTTYSEYLNKFVDVFKPQLISYDHYPFNTNSDGIRYFENLSEIQKLSSKSKVPFMVILQASSWISGKRIPTGEELRWQVYTSLAYGAQGISWYVYGYPGHDGSMMYPKMSNKQNKQVVIGGDPTPLYYYTKILNKEFISLASQLKGLVSIGGYHVGMIPQGASELPKSSNFKITPYLESKKYKFPIEGFLIGLYGNSYNATHALIVNLDYRTYGGRKHKRRNDFIKENIRYISSSNCLETFNTHDSRWVVNNSNKVKLDMPPGAAILVRLFQTNDSQYEKCIQ